jgi:hypothetical protein
MTKTSTHGIPAFKEAMETQKKDFLETLQTLDFKEFTTEKKLKEATENPKIQPKRATFDNIIQKQYYHIYPNGDKIHIHTGMIGDDFASTGTAWDIGIDKESEDKISLICPRNNGASLLFRLSACTQLLKQIFDNRPKNTILVEVAHDVFVWRSKNPKDDDTPIDFLRYAKYLPKKERDYLTNRFKKSAKWIKDNPNRKRRRNIRGTYEVLKKTKK